jgi:hypothetical protein
MAENFAARKLKMQEGLLQAVEDESGPAADLQKGFRPREVFSHRADDKLIAGCEPEVAGLKRCESIEKLLFETFDVLRKSGRVRDEAFDLLRLIAACGAGPSGGRKARIARNTTLNCALILGRDD